MLSCLLSRPPRDAEATAQRVIDALSGGSRADRLFYADLNAVSPATTKRIAAMFEKARAPVRFIDGCILGAPPRLKSDADPGTNVSMSDTTSKEFNWARPRIPISGPHSLAEELEGGERLASVLNLRSISSEIGAASGLKMCFAAMTKGYTAIATQSFSTAHRLGVAGELRKEMAAVIPTHLGEAEKGVPSMVPKAYRWVREMEEIAATMNEEGGWGRDIFTGAAGVYKAVAEDEVLSKEKTGKRNRGTSIEDVAAAIGEGFERKRKKTE
uniref:Phosphogluconate dehydrogenase NAD-binding putative C-terminal domain-containing protein n=1 Tax=Bionectria ochroleuca TaxID=29856 RepID=A0A8H7NA49_BIOOC